jgi:hypothetical protein
MKLRFSIRDLLWLTAVAALLTAWWLDRGRLAERIYRLEHPIKYRITEPSGQSFVVEEPAAP